MLSTKPMVLKQAAPKNKLKPHDKIDKLKGLRVHNIKLITSKFSTTVSICNQYLDIIGFI